MLLSEFLVLEQEMVKHLLVLLLLLYLKNLMVLDVDTPIQISGVSVNGYTGQFVVSEKNSATEIEYKAPSSPITALPSTSDIAEGQLTIVTDTVTSASPYIFNISLRSVYGACGMHADGDKADVL